MLGFIFGGGGDSLSPKNVLNENISRSLAHTATRLICELLYLLYKSLERAYVCKYRVYLEDEL